MWTLLITVIVLPISAVFLLLRYIRGDTKYWEKRGVPMPDSKVTFSQRFKLPFHELDQSMYNSAKSQNVNNYFGKVEMRKPMLFVMNEPELIKSILVKDFHIFTNRRSFGLSKGRGAINNMLFFMEDEPWKDMRSTMSPTFSTGKIKAMNDIFIESGGKVVNYLEQQVSESTDSVLEVNIQDVYGRYALDVIASAAFGVDSENFTKSNSVFYQMSQRINMNATISIKLLLKFLILILVPKLFTWLKLTIFDKVALLFFEDVVERTIKQRESNPTEKRKDFLQLMIDAKHGLLEKDADDEASLAPNQNSIRGVTLTNDSILANCVLFFIAGFDATESLLTFATYELALNPEIQERLYEEVDDTLEKYNGELTYEAVASMNYLDMVISETLRKYPAAFRLERQAGKDYKLPNSEVVVGKGSLVIIPVHSIHHDPDIYPNPEQFIPERFSAENKAQRNPYVYLPFGAGPRHCIATRFALVEAKSAIAHMVHRFRFEPSSKTQIPVVFKRSASALKPKDGLYLSVKSRE